MVKAPIIKPRTTKPPILKDPGLVFYKPAVRDTLKRGNVAEIKALLKGAKDIQKEFGDLGGLIAHLEQAAARAK